MLILLLGSILLASGLTSVVLADTGVLSLSTDVCRGIRVVALFAIFFGMKLLAFFASNPLLPI